MRLINSLPIILGVCECCLVPFQRHCSSWQYANVRRAILDSLQISNLGWRFRSGNYTDGVARFDRTFAQSYLQGISIHHTCSAIEYDRAPPD